MVVVIGHESRPQNAGAPQGQREQGPRPEGQIVDGPHVLIVALVPKEALVQKVKVVATVARALSEVHVKRAKEAVIAVLVPVLRAVVNVVTSPGTRRRS